MSRVLDANQIAERALRMVGAFPITETAPKAEALREALFWIDLTLATNSALREIFWLQPATLTMPLVAGQQAYVLQTALGSDYPPDGIQFPTMCEIEYPTSMRLPVLIASRQKWEELMRPGETGIPRIVYIDRAAVGNRLLVWPTLPATETQTYNLKLVVQTYSPDLSPAAVSGARPNDTKITGIRLGWQEWLVLSLAYKLGAGPIYKLPETSLARWERQANAIRSELESFENREHDTEPPTVASYGITDYEVRASGLDTADSYTIPMGGYSGYLL